ncbi:hypothetical protein vBSlqSZDD2_60 [Serratia phage vB_SlqS_ZDD2]|nr:hypothetical protein vBSlqSZDD2_60 [Serratia phage vB_SlqS_ZDD2]
MKHIEAGCLAIITNSFVAGEVGKSVRVTHQVNPGDEVYRPDGSISGIYGTGNEPGWYCVGDLRVIDKQGNFSKSNVGFAIYTSAALMRIDEPDEDDKDDELINMLHDKHAGGL